MRKKLILIIIAVIVIASGLVIWRLFDIQPEVIKEEPTTQVQASEPVTAESSQCKLVNGVPTYTYNISESAVVDAIYEIFDDTKTGEKGLLPGGESINWTTLDPEIMVSIDDGEPKKVAATPCVVSVIIPAENPQLITGGEHA